MRWLITLLLFSDLLAAQTARTFEAASIKPHPGLLTRMGVLTAGDRLDAVDYASGLILFAFDLKNYQMIGNPALNAVNETAYDVIAKAEGRGEPSPAEFRLMMRQMLADRFRLKFHREQREMPVYELTIAKSGPKLKPAAADAKPGMKVNFTGRNYEVTVPAAAMDDIVSAIVTAGQLDRPVIDKTGLKGRYAVKLFSTPRNARPTVNPVEDDVSIFTAVQEQLGLKLEARKGMIEVLVIDTIEKPSEN